MLEPEITLAHEFVEFLPGNIQGGKLYISIPYATATHKCCCGCDNEVVTPLSPTDWKLIFNGESVSLDPSIGNWSFDCQSHYWIKKNRVIWAKAWSKERIKDGRTHDRLLKRNHYEQQSKPFAPEEPQTVEPQTTSKNHLLNGLWANLKALWPF